jgi:hypothetical protein
MRIAISKALFKRGLRLDEATLSPKAKHDIVALQVTPVYRLDLTMLIADGCSLLFVLIKDR